MTITIPKSLPGAAAFARRTAPVSGALDPRIPTGTLATYPAASVKTLLARGREGFVGIVDRLQVAGLADNANQTLFVLRSANVDDSGGEELAFPLIAWTPYTVCDRGTVNAAGTTSTNIVSNEALTASLHVGRYLVLTSGALSGQIRLITANDASAFTTPAFGGVPAGSVTYDIRDYSMTRRWFNWEIDRLGYVMPSAQTKAAQAAPLPGRNFPYGLGAFQYVVSGAQSAELECSADIRYAELGAQGSMSIRPAIWSYQSPIGAGAALLAAAPGVGLHYRIHTIILIANGSAATGAGQRVSLAYNATPANGLIQEWYSYPAGDGYRIEQFLTDIDVALPDNSPIYCNVDSDFALLRTMILVGAEIAKTGMANHLSLTGAPQ